MYVCIEVRFNTYKIITCPFINTIRGTISCVLLYPVPPVVSGECRKIIVQFGENYLVNVSSEETETQFLIVLETKI